MVAPDRGRGTAVASVVRMERTLFLLLRVLNHSGITAAARMPNAAAIEVWLGDADHGVRRSAVFSRRELPKAVAWLTEHAVRLYPDSDFARVRNLLTAWTASAEH
jgi:hypothetical protein